jgi:hypothetical protein
LYWTIYRERVLGLGLGFLLYYGSPRDVFHFAYFYIDGGRDDGGVLFLIYFIR